MTDTVTFEVSKELKSAIDQLKKSGKPISLEIQGSIINEELVINQIDSKSQTRGAVGQHCWHALSKKLIDEKNP